MSDFPHLPLPKIITGEFKHPKRKIDRTVSETTSRNLQNRVAHGRTLRNSVDQLTRDWTELQKTRQDSNLPPLPSPEVIPIFLQVDSELFDTDSLYALGIEVIAEEDEGFIIGAAADNFKSLKEKINKFIANKGNYKKASQLWEIITGTQWKLDYILSDELKAKWDQINDAEELIVDVSIACAIKSPPEPTKKKTETKTDFSIRYENWRERKQQIEIERDDLEEERQIEFANFIIELGGERLSAFVGYNDSFSCRLKLTGRALKDLVLNYQYLFDVHEYDSLTYIDDETGAATAFDLNTTSPDENSPRICVIDSGIQEGHRLIAKAIDTSKSKSYVPGDNSTFDGVSNGGHGTKVAGAILFGNNIPTNGEHKFDVWLHNARVLSNDRSLSSRLFPPQLMKDIVDDFSECKIFNLSINTHRPCRTMHMSEWCSAIDSIMHERDKLFIISTGNISRSSVYTTNPGISEHLSQGRNYPNYLFENASRIANPAQSCFALTVGSVCISKYEDNDRESFGDKDEPSSFTRTGLGLWNMIKPDVVEYGGDFIREKASHANLACIQETSPNVVKTNINGGHAVGFDIGTSYAAPKVTKIAGAIMNQIPNATSRLIKALIVQSARLPANKIHTPSLTDIRTFGYGIPNIMRATENSSKRITMISEDQIKPKSAEIYTIKIPREIRRAGNEFNTLIEVSLSFTASPRRTRRKINSYLSNWVDWQSSKFDESYDSFKKRTLKVIEEGNDSSTTSTEDAGTIKWKIRERVDWGHVKGIRRQDNSIQKDWTIVKAYQLPEEFSIAVIGHKGWNKDVYSDIPYSLVVSFEALDSEVDIYSQIRVENEIELPIEQEVQIQQ